jgi:hypothetical protein
MIKYLAPCVPELQDGDLNYTVLHWAFINAIWQYIQQEVAQL